LFFFSNKEEAQIEAPESEILWLSNTLTDHIFSLLHNSCMKTFLVFIRQCTVIQTKIWKEYCLWLQGFHREKQKKQK